MGEACYRRKLQILLYEIQQNGKMGALHRILLYEVQLQAGLWEMQG